MKNCVRCAGRFDRVPAARRKLKDGSTFDPNLHCPSCEVVIVNEAAQQRTVRPPSAVELARMNGECLRKEAFEQPHLARSVAKKMRRRHRGASTPVAVYRCRVPIDPTAFPDRAKAHWHIGGQAP